MNIIKILKRKDASSVVVAVVLALIVSQAVSGWAERPSDWISGVTSSGGGWRAGLWEPLVFLVIQVVVLEIIIRIYTALAANQGKK